MNTMKPRWERLPQQPYRHFEGQMVRLLHDVTNSTGQVHEDGSAVETVWPKGTAGIVVKADPMSGLLGGGGLVVLVDGHRLKLHCKRDDVEVWIVPR
jgi:hypothetical protein